MAVAFLNARNFGFLGHAAAHRAALRRIGYFVRVFIAVALIVLTRVLEAETVSIVVPSNAAPRVEFGAEKLADALKAVKMDVVIAHSTKINGRGIYLYRPLMEQDKEGFRLQTQTNGDLSIMAVGDSGMLYGCLELAKRIREAGKLPEKLDFADAPKFVLRGPCIGMQKTFILPGRHVYEYPYTPELFPFFYDKQFWQEYLDFLVENRMNTLYLWNGHPFASLVKLKDYPYAMEVPEDVFAKNTEMFRYIAQECDKRGIWLVQMFYSIIVSQPFAEHFGTSSQLAAPTPEAADYTRKSIAEFVHQYPNVGLMVCLGEALQGLDNQVMWCMRM